MPTTIVYVDALAGAIDSGHGLGTGTTTLVSVALQGTGANPGVPSLTSTEAFRLSFFVVNPTTGQITAREDCLAIGPYTSGAGSITIQRAQNGTTAQTWAAGSLWAHGWSQQDAVLFQGGSRSVTLSVASSQAANPGDYDYVCTGSDDDLVINQALHAVQLATGGLGGKVVLSEGWFYTGNEGVHSDAPLSSLEGQGWSRTAIVTSAIPTPNQPTPGGDRLAVVAFGTRQYGVTATISGSTMTVSTPGGNSFEQGESINFNAFGTSAFNGDYTVLSTAGTWPNQTSFTVAKPASLSSGSSTGNCYGEVDTPICRDFTVSGVANVGGIQGSFNHVGHGLHMSANRNPMIQDVFFNCVQNHGVQIAGDGLQGYFKNIQGRGAGTWQDYTVSSVLNNSSARQTNNDGIYVSADGGNHVFEGCIISGQIHRVDDGGPGPTTRHGIHLACSGADLFFCHPYETANWGLFCDGSNQVTVHGGQYETCGEVAGGLATGGTAANSGSGIYANDCYGLDISGVVTYDNTWTSMRFDGCDTVTVTGWRQQHTGLHNNDTGAIASAYVYNSKHVRFVNSDFDIGIVEAGTAGFGSGQADDLRIDSTCRYRPSSYFTNQTQNVRIGPTSFREQYFQPHGMILPHNWDVTLQTGYFNAIMGNAKLVVACEGDSITGGANGNSPQVDQWLYGFVGRLQALLLGDMDPAAVGFNWGACDVFNWTASSAPMNLAGGSGAVAPYSGGFGQILRANDDTSVANAIQIQPAALSGINGSKNPTGVDIYTVDVGPSNHWTVNVNGGTNYTINETTGSGTPSDGSGQLRRTRINFTASSYTVNLGNAVSRIQFAFAVINYGGEGLSMVRNAVSGFRAIDWAVGAGATAGYFSSSTWGITPDPIGSWAQQSEDILGNTTWVSPAVTFALGDTGVTAPSRGSPVFPGAHLTVLASGVNDWSYGSREDQFARYFARRIHAARAGYATANATDNNPSSVIILDLCAPSIYSDNQLGLPLNPTEAWRYKKIKQEIAAAHCCAYIDIDSLWSETPVASGFMFNGNRHPSANGGGAGGGDGHLFIAKQIYNVIKAGARG